MTKTLIIADYGAFLSAKQGIFVIKRKNEKKEIPAIELDSIVFQVKGSSLSVAALKLANDFNIDVTFMDGNKMIGRFLPYQYGTLMKSWLNQLKAFKKRRLDLAKKFVYAKIYNQRRVLMEYHRRFVVSGKEIDLRYEYYLLEKRIEEVDKCKDIKELLAVESHAAKTYWQAVASIIPKELGFEHRYTKSNPPPSNEYDAFNFALNIGYACLRKEVWRSIFLVGLNPYLGFYHIPRGTRPSLVLDLMEEFRAISVDRPLISLAKNKPEIIIKAKQNNEIKEIFAYVLKYMKESNPSHIDLILSQARKLASAIREGNEYRPYLSKW